MTDNIDALIARVIEREGGYSNNPNDNGGPTKYGITLATLHGWRQAPVSAADVQSLTTSEAAQIYRRNYFVGPGLDAVKDPEIQEFLFDYGVNSGPGAADVARREGRWRLRPGIEGSPCQDQQPAGAVLPAEMRAL